MRMIQMLGSSWLQARGANPQQLLPGRLHQKDLCDAVEKAITGKSSQKPSIADKLS